jgi:hypothetical protein
MPVQRSHVQGVAAVACSIVAVTPLGAGDGFTVRGSSSAPHPVTSSPATANVDTTTARTDRTNMTPPREDQQTHHGAPQTAAAQQPLTRCGVQTADPLRIETQVEQTIRCLRAPGHDGQHLAVARDSDDNAITVRWTGGTP